MNSSENYKIKFAYDNQWHRYINFIAITCLAIILGLSIVNLPIKSWLLLFIIIPLPIFFINPSRFLLGYLAFSPIIDQMIPFFSTGSLGLNFGPQILFRGGLIVLLMFYWFVNQKNPFYLLSAKIMFAFIFLTTLTTLINFSNIISIGRPALAVAELSKIVFWMILMVTVADLVSEKKLNIKSIYNFMLLSIIFTLISILISEYLGLQIRMTYWNVGVKNITGAFAPHSLAISLCIGLAVPLTLTYLYERKTSIFLILLFSIAIVISILRTYVRTGYTSLAGVLLTLNVFSLYYGRFRNSKKKNYTINIFTVLIILVSLFYTTINIEFLEKRFSDLSDPEKAGGGRLKIYESAITYFNSYNIFEKFIGKGIVTGLQYLDKNIATHNEYLSILLSSGILGLCLFLWLFFELWKEIKPHDNENYIPFAISASSIVVYLIASVTNNVMTYASVTTYFAFLVGSSIGCNQIRNT